MNNIHTNSYCKKYFQCSWERSYFCREGQKTFLEVVVFALSLAEWEGFGIKMGYEERQEYR